jgi:hypothetical protein
MKLRCLKVGKWSHFFPDDICEVTKNENGSMTVYNPEGEKRVSKFTYTECKNILFEGTLFRLQCPLP